MFGWMWFISEGRKLHSSHNCWDWNQSVWRFASL